MTKQKRLEKQAKDMVDMALTWQKLVYGITVAPPAYELFNLFDTMQAEVLKTYTDIEEKNADKD